MTLQMDVQTDGRTDGRTDRRTGVLQYSCFFFEKRGDKNLFNCCIMRDQAGVKCCPFHSQHLTKQPVLFFYTSIKWAVT